MLPSTLISILSGIRSISEELPVLSAQDAEDARRALAIYDTMPARTDPRRITAMIGELALAYPRPNLTPAEAEGRLEVYIKGLEDLPPDWLRGAFADAVKRHKFFPTVAELRVLAMSQPIGPHRWRQFVPKHLLMAHDRNRNWSE